MTTRGYLGMIHRCVSADNITFEEISPDYVYRVRHNGRSFLMIDTELGLNNSASSSIALSKSAAFHVLDNAGVPAVEHIFLQNPASRFAAADPYLQAEERFGTYGNCAVVKPDTGAQGRHVHRVDHPAELRRILDQLFALELDVSISPFYEAETEYRIVTLNGEPQLYLAKKRTTSWKHNLISGAVSVEVDTPKLQPLAHLARKASEALGLAFCSVDILETASGFRVIEINHKVMLDEYCKHDGQRIRAVSELYRRAILQRFQSESGLPADIQQGLAE